MHIRRLLPALAPLAAVSSVSALTIVPTYDPTVSSRSDFAQIQSAMNYAITQFDNELSDPITVNIIVAAGNVTLGQSSFGLTDTNPSWKYANIKSFLTTGCQKHQ